MLNTKLLLITAALMLLNQLHNTASAQNLVPNPSFEDTVACPTTTDQVNLSTGWSSYCPSPDYYNACNAGALSVPYSAMAYQPAASCDAYAGFIAYAKGGFVRELIGRQLSQNLIIGQTYYVSIKVALSEFEGPPPQYIPCNKVGVKFSTVAYSASNCAPVNNFAHIYTDSIISDTMNWTTIKGSFIADSIYQYIMIGNFFDDSQTDTINLPNGVYSYFFVDDVCVSTDSLTCYTYSVTCSETNVKDYKDNVSLRIFPNPINEILSIEYPDNGKCFVEIYDGIGKLIFSENFFKQLSINTSDFSNGIYFIKTQSNNKTVTQKIIINH